MENIPNQSDLQTLGQRLRSARQKLHLSEKDAASRLHLNSQIVAMLESDDFDNAPHTTFFRGYLRSYAKLLNFSEREIRDMLKEIECRFPSSIQAPQAPLNIAPAQTNQGHRRYTHWMTYSIVVVLVSMVGIWWNSHTRYSIADVPEKIATETPAATLPDAIAPVMAGTDTKAPSLAESPAANTIAPPSSTFTPTLGSTSAANTAPTAKSAAPKSADQTDEPTVTASNEDATTPEETKPQAQAVNQDDNSDPYNNDY